MIIQRTLKQAILAASQSFYVVLREDLVFCLVATEIGVEGPKRQEYSKYADILLEIYTLEEQESYHDRVNNSPRI